jgi:SH3 domain-containing YSC84-like protein 1
MRVPVRFALVALVACAACGAPPRSPTAVDTAERRAAEDRVAGASQVLNGIRDAPDAGLPLGIARGARCIVVVPSMVQVALVVGARRGRGVASCLAGDGWSPPVFVRATGAGAGLAIGVASVELVLVVVSDDTARSLLRTRVELGIDSAIAAGPVGRSAEAATTLGQGTFSYSRASGVFAGVSIADLVLEHDEEAQRAYYGDTRTFGVLLQGSAPAPASAASFLGAVRGVVAP